MKPGSRFSVRLVALMAIVFIGFTCYLHSPDMTKPPGGMHTWAQSDHYALARGFVENDLNFFLPQTALYNHQFPNNWQTPDPDCITAVDFPIHNYIPAVFMKITGSDSTLIYRCYMLLLSFAGLFCLYRLAFMFNKSAILSFLVVAFVACSPVFTFYQIRFIPSIPSLSTALIGLYYYFRYRRDNSMKALIVAVVFLTLAAMTRLTFTIPLLAVFGVEFIRLFREPENRVKKIVVALSSIVFILSYMLYNAYLRDTYGSLFLNVLMPITSFRDLIDSTLDIFGLWKMEYFTRWHYLLFAALCAVFGYRFIRKKHIRAPFSYTALLIFLLSLGCVLFYLAMCEQFKAHDYYFADTFFVPIILVLCVLTQQLTIRNTLQNVLLYVCSCLLIVGMAYRNTLVQESRDEREKWGKNDYTTYCYEGSNKLIEELKIPKSEKLLVLTTVSPNIPFMEMKRSGYMTHNNATQNLQLMMKFPVRYVVFQTELFATEIYASWPGVINYLEIIGSNGRITVCRKTDYTPKSLFQFLQLDTKTPVFSGDFADTTVSQWEATVRRFDETDKTFEFLSADEFGPVLKLRANSLFDKDRILIYEGDILWDQEKDIEFVLSFAEGKELTMFKVYSLKNTMNKPGEWCHFRFVLTIPKSAASRIELSAYLHNSDAVNYRVKNVKSSLY